MLDFWLLIRCPLYTDENIVHTAAVEAAARLIINELKASKPELLRTIDMDKILPVLKNTNQIKLRNSVAYSVTDVDRLVALIIGQNVEDIKNLGMSECGIYFDKSYLIIYLFIFIF